MQELDKIMEIACKQYTQNNRMDYLKLNAVDGSMYTARVEAPCLQRLDCETPVRLQAQLHEMWGDSPEWELLEKVLVVAAFKLRSAKDIYHDVIKEKVYNF